MDERTHLFDRLVISSPKGPEGAGPPGVIKGVYELENRLGLGVGVDEAVVQRAATVCLVVQLKCGGDDDAEVGACAADGPEQV